MVDVDEGMAVASRVLVGVGDGVFVGGGVLVAVGGTGVSVGAMVLVAVASGTVAVLVAPPMIPPGAVGVAADGVAVAPGVVLACAVSVAHGVAVTDGVDGVRVGDGVPLAGGVPLPAARVPAADGVAVSVGDGVAVFVGEGVAVLVATAVLVDCRVVSADVAGVFVPVSAVAAVVIGGPGGQASGPGTTTPHAAGAVASNAPLIIEPLMTTAVLVRSIAASIVTVWSKCS